MSRDDVRLSLVGFGRLIRFDLPLAENLTGEGWIMKVRSAKRSDYGDWLADTDHPST